MFQRRAGSHERCSLHRLAPAGMTKLLLLLRLLLLSAETNDE
jgi:hypothetical protein